MSVDGAGDSGRSGEASRVGSEHCDAAALEIDADAIASFVARVGALAVVDLETTGLTDDSRAEILEVGILLLDVGSSNVRTLSCLVRPRRSIPPLVQRLAEVLRGFMLEKSKPRPCRSGCSRTSRGAPPRGFIQRWSPVLRSIAVIRPHGGLTRGRPRGPGG